MRNNTDTNLLIYSVLKIYTVVPMLICFIFPILKVGNNYQWPLELSSFNYWAIVFLFFTSLLKLRLKSSLRLIAILAVIELILIIDILFDLRFMLASDIITNGGDPWFYGKLGNQSVFHWIFNIGRSEVHVMFGFYLMTFFVVIYFILGLIEVHGSWKNYKIGKR